MFVVVGSGPAGVACAMALLDRGKPVLMLDVGITLEPDKARLLAPLETQAPGAWSPDALALLRSGTQPRTSGLQLKLAYGSDYAYQSAEAELGIERDRVACVPSFARGGMSNVWGGSMLPYRDDDMVDWPIGAAELAPHYRAVLSFVPHSVVHDRLESEFPSHSTSAEAVPSSAQALDLLRDLEASSSRLGREGVVFGRSRLAVSPQCIRCGLCMYGCPRHFIYDSSSTLAHLATRAGFSYRPGVIVERVRESGAEVLVETRTLDGGSGPTFHAERALLACGPLSTTRIVLASLEAYDREVLLHDSQYYLFPMLRYRTTRGFDAEPVHSLAQVFLELFDRELSTYSVHLQLYSYNDLYKRVFEGMLGPARGLLPYLPLRPLLGRMWIAQGYLHSSESPGIRAVLTRPDARGGSRMRLQATHSPETPGRVRRVVRKLASLRDSLRMVPLAPMVRLGDAGQGYHVGGAFPMRATPGPFQSDVLGRPSGFERVHLVDSTTFPSIPASTVTFTVLANAHRIGSMVAA